MTSKKKLRSLLGGTLFMVLMLSVHPTTVSASAVGSSTVMDQSVETEDQQSGIQSETQTQASQDSVAAVRASQNGWVKAGDGGWYFYENGQLKTGWLYRNGNWYWLDPDRNGRMAENSWFTYDNNFYYAKGDGAIYKNGFQEVDGNLYYFQSWGGIQKNVYLSISGKMYYVQENGIVARGIVRTMNGHGDLCAFDDTTGAQITQKGWLKKGTSYYWVREDGVLQTGWLLYDDNWYWFDDNGVMMASGWTEINNNLYYFQSWGWKLHAADSRHQLSMGIPMALQFAITASGTMIMQAAINLFGSEAVAAFTAACKLQNLVTQGFSAMGQTMATYSGQNFGKGDIPRIKKGVRAALLTSVTYSIAAAALVFLLLKPCLSLFFSGDVDMAAMMPWAKTYSYMCALFYVPLCTIFIFRNAMQGCGYGFLPMMGGVSELFARLIVAVIAIKVISYPLACFCDP